MEGIYLNKSTIDKNMHRIGARFYVDLLKKVGVELGEKDLDNFVTREKSNFSKMLSGKRTLNINYIVPLERIFGLSVLTLTGQKGYEVPDDPDGVPYLKSFRYFAYKDDPTLYEELDKMTTPEGDFILKERDEYNREFIDYTIEYRSLNGVDFLIEKHGLTYDPVHRQIAIDGYFRYDDEQTLSLALMLAQKSPERFVSIFHPVDCLADPFNGFRHKLFQDPELLREILGNDDAIDALLCSKTYLFETMNPQVFPKDGATDGIVIANPMIASLLSRIEASNPIKTKVLEYTSAHNRDTERRLRYPLEEYYIDKNGFIRLGGAIYGNVILPEEETEGLYVPNIKKLPRNEK